MSKSSPPSSSAHAGGLLSLQRVTPFEAGAVPVASAGVGSDGWLLEVHSAAGGGLSPPLSWTRNPQAESYVLIVEDPDAPGERPFLHWLVWNLPGDLQGLPGGVPHGARPRELSGAVQGANSRGELGWHGAAPPPGGGPHRYHFQLFALAGRLDHLQPEHARLDEVVDALKGLTLAAGELVALFETPDPASARPAEPRGFLPSGEAQGAAERGGLDADDLDRHAPHDPDGTVRPQA